MNMYLPCFVLAELVRMYSKCVDSPFPCQFVEVSPPSISFYQAGEVSSGPRNLIQNMLITLLDPVVTVVCSLIGMLVAKDFV